MSLERSNEQQTDGSSRVPVELDALQWGRLNDWAQLVRLPNAFTLISNTVAAALVAGSWLQPISAFLPVVLASLFAYWAGMILNDIVDLQEDRQYRPNRPLAAGRISPTIAGHVANAMLIFGPLIVLAVTNFKSVQKQWMGAAFLCAVLLSIAVKSYNSALKATMLGPILMGLCRSLNILMVGCTMFSMIEAEAFPRSLLWYAAAIGLYIVGVTVYARREETSSHVGTLSSGLILEVCGMILLALFPLWSDGSRGWELDPQVAYPLLIVLIGFTVVQRGIVGIQHPAPRKVQLAVRHAILTLILLDASVSFMWAGRWYGGGVALMLLPALTAALKVRST